jgi:hypothetical protein
MQITKLLTIFDVFNDVDAAVAAFSQPSVKGKSAKGPAA